jgi:hypothetical protein
MDHLYIVRTDSIEAQISQVQVISIDCKKKE